MMANLGTKKLDKYDKFYYIISMEDEVSKYSTEELICFLEGSYAETPPGMMDIVSAKLHAADKLCEAAKKSADEWWRITHEAAKFGKPIVPQNYDLFISDQVKAISDFES